MFVCCCNLTSPVLIFCQLHGVSENLRTLLLSSTSAVTAGSQEFKEQTQCNLLVSGSCNFQLLYAKPIIFCNSSATKIGLRGTGRSVSQTRWTVFEIRRVEPTISHGPGSHSADNRISHHYTFSETLNDCQSSSSKYNCLSSSLILSPWY